MGLGELVSISAAVFWGLSVVLFRQSGESMPPFELNFVKNSIAILLLIPTILIAHGLELPSYSYADLGLTILSGLLGLAIADTWYFKGLTYLGAARMGVVATIYSPSVVFLSTIFLGQTLNSMQFAGMALVLGGIVMVTWRQNREEISVGDLRKGLFFGGSAVFLTAVGVILVEGVLDREPFFWTTILRLLAGLAGMTVFMTLRREWPVFISNLRKPHPWKTVILAAFLGSYLSMCLWLAGYKLINPSIASVLNETASAFIVFFAWLILKEHISKQKLAGLLLTMTGVLVVLMN